MRLLTWNIRHGAASRAGRVVDAIRTHAPDLAVLTEFRSNSAGRVIRDGLSAQGLRYQSDDYTGSRNNCVLIASRLPLTANACDACGSLQHRCIAATVDEVTVLGVYFPNLHAKKPLFSSLLGIEAE